MDRRPIIIVLSLIILGAGMMYFLSSLALHVRRPRLDLSLGRPALPRIGLADGSGNEFEWLRHAMTTAAIDISGIASE